ncbi:DUF1697 domain-containing protein [Candidatus Marinamargulisbacteria bacterium SCGC AG-410-N11]|nr:DUF1697 domain-containing protein [Candidatus Marinamargulisbacteria bacterium SCGC AG-410-N11]
MIYISLLRGINVGGHKKVLMKDLKSAYQDLEFQYITTHLQSGNVIFSSLKSNQHDLRAIIETKLKSSFGFNIPVQILSRQDLEVIFKSCPFGLIDLQTDGTKVLVSFLSNEPSPDKQLSIQQNVQHPEKLVIQHKAAYLFCPNGYGRSKLSNTFIESQLGVRSTTRNWKTVSNLLNIIRSNDYSSMH